MMQRNEQLKRYLKYAFDFSIGYYSLFVIICWISYFRVLPVHPYFFEVLKAGFLLFWFYLVMLILQITKLIQLGRSRFLFLSGLFFLTALFYLLTGIK